MRKVLVAASLFVLAACASKPATTPVTRPEVTIVQTRGVVPAARYESGPITVKYAVRVANKAGQPITLKRIVAQSLGMGAYTLSSTSRPFNATIAPDGYQDVEFWANAVAEPSTVVGANGPVTLRLILHFESAAGPFEDVVVQQVNDQVGVSGQGPG